jgi:hypothetical protein
MYFPGPVPDRCEERWHERAVKARKFGGASRYHPMVNVARCPETGWPPVRVLRVA